MRRLRVHLINQENSLMGRHRSHLRHPALASEGYVLAEGLLHTLRLRAEHLDLEDHDKRLMNILAHALKGFRREYDDAVPDPRHQRAWDEYWRATGDRIAAFFSFLDVPYAEKGEASHLGAKFEEHIRKWYIPPGLPREQFRWPSYYPTPDEKHVLAMAEAEGKLRRPNYAEDPSERNTGRGFHPSHLMCEPQSTMAPFDESWLREPEMRLPGVPYVVKVKRGPHLSYRSAFFAAKRFAEELEQIAGSHECVVAVLRKIERMGLLRRRGAWNPATPEFVQTFYAQTDSAAKAAILGIGKEATGTKFELALPKAHLGCRPVFQLPA
ncbi:DUF5710 domain-containing protein [Noviherbaspirillum pedocola]|uniref:DUF5710 domain-containing protein n=1 Tax=Noviherbaspirillum pedocola TaxID=2801341 RepID=A0A934SVL6_9BURK|nr:DUF5710 domain-containing protein [Noviherbaspirillum pedocola]MBK4736173.1 hypothetical protein [Noviherbaspirillum pedocola]